MKWVVLLKSPVRVFFPPCRKFLFLVAILTLSSACATSPSVVTQNSASFAPGPYELYVVSHGWHTGLVVRAEEVFKALPMLTVLERPPI